MNYKDKGFVDFFDFSSFIGDYLLKISLILLSIIFFSTPLLYASRIKDIASFEGVRDNHLIGYGLVVGLDGTGDKSGTEFTIQSLVNMLNRLGVKVSSGDVKVKNVAAVIVTSELSPFKNAGSRVDVVVSSIGDAKSLQGGTLLFTPLKGADGNIYVVAQGSVSVGGGFLAGAEGTSVQKNHLTVGRIPNGGLVEKEVPLRFENNIMLVLKQIDFTTSSKVAKKINAVFGGEIAFPVDGSRIRLSLPETFNGRSVDFLSNVEKIRVSVDTISKVVINERTGTIIIGENVSILPVAISHGSLSVEITTRRQISQPLPFSSGKTVVQPEADVSVNEGKSRLLMVEGATLGELIRALNALGVTPRDLIALLQAMKAAGALQAEIEFI